MERWGKLPLLRGLFFMGAFASDVHSAPFAKPSVEGFTALSALSAAGAAHFLRLQDAMLIFRGAPFTHSCRQIFMRDRKRPTRMCE